MNADDIEPERVDQFIVYGAFGEVMHSFQVFELVLWGFLTRGFKRGISLDQAMERVEHWDSTTLGKLWRGLRTQDHWPDRMVAEVNQAVAVCNYLAHHFLREHFLVRPSTEHRDNVVAQLATIAHRLDALIDAMEAHSRALGIPGVDELDQETKHEIEALRPTSWFTGPPTRDRTRRARRVCLPPTPVSDDATSSSLNGSMTRGTSTSATARLGAAITCLPGCLSRTRQCVQPAGDCGAGGRTHTVDKLRTG